MSEHEPLQTRIVRGDPRTLETLPAERNARFMKAPTFKRLVENIKRDGVLTQLPLVYRGVILSGNHRVRAAIEAGLTEIEWLELLGEHSEARLLAIQLSHNAISGEDDPNTLAALYAELAYDEKLYSGITDAVLDLDKLDLDSLGLGATHYEEIVVTFLPEQARELEVALKRFEAAAKKRPAFVARRGDFELIFETVIKTKAKKAVWNTALALALMAELAGERLEQLDAEEKAAAEERKPAA